MNLFNGDEDLQRRYADALKTSIDKTFGVEMNNEPVAWINIEDGNSILDWEKDEYAQKHYPLYTHPVKEQYKFGVDWSKDGKSVTVVKICEDGVAEVVFMDYQEVTNPVKELTDEEIDSVAMSCEVGDRFNKLNDEIYTRDFARAILRKAQEK